MKMTKKVLAILAVLAIVAGFAFAADPVAPTAEDTETHKITVQTVVDEIVPKFSFRVGALKTNENKVAFTKNASYTAVGTFEIPQDDNKDISEAAIVQDFTIVSVADANYLRGFKFTVAATAFQSNTKGDDGLTPKYKTDGTIGIVYAKSSADLSADHITMTDDASYIQANYSGRQFTAEVTLGTVTVTWPQDKNAIPDTYTADVTLTVTAL